MNSQNEIKTYFMSPERSSPEIINKEMTVLLNNSTIHQLIEGFPEIVVLLNEHRQIIACNSIGLKSFGCENIYEISGKRIGEALNCIQAFKFSGGCGTSIFCKECGAAKALNTTINLNSNAVEECRITADINGIETAFDFRVFTQSIVYDKNIYTMVTLRDISNEKRKESLERIFFHDVLNTVSAARGLAEVLPEFDDKTQRVELISSLLGSMDQLIDEIVSQQELSNAEKGNLSPNMEVEKIENIVKGVKRLYSIKIKNGKINLDINVQNPDLEIITDQHLLIRSLGNLLKNAIEASNENDTIDLNVIENKKNIQFKISNQAIIPQNIQLQLFQRSFSTKNEKGRGIGLYSVKLIIEQYLKGNVGFVSNKKQGTVFTLSLPK
ncbi:MAG: HAMP domain-containing histidine kinase [Bacteroidetes bacterium]|nr:HAMP domain-containing histidine kinase [Bacteroidota bacterium]